MSLRAPWDDVAPPSPSPLRTNAEAFRDTLHAVSLLHGFMRGGVLDAATFRSVSEVLIAAAQGRSGNGEMVNLLWREWNHSHFIPVEGCR